MNVGRVVARWEKVLVGVCRLRVQVCYEVLTFD